MSRKITSKPGLAAITQGLRLESRPYYRFFRLKLTGLFRRYPEQCFALMVLLILISAAVQIYYIF